VRNLDGTWGEDARRAITENPDYFVWWYSVKSLALVAAIGAAAYYAGRSSGSRPQQRGLAGCPEVAALERRELARARRRR
jgi:hypothetical protein